MTIAKPAAKATIPRTASSQVGKSSSSAIICNGEKVGVKGEKVRDLRAHSTVSESGAGGEMKVRRGRNKKQRHSNGFL